LLGGAGAALSRAASFFSITFGAVAGALLVIFLGIYFAFAQAPASPQRLTAPCPI
jgi:hypothetical protein